MDQLIGGKYRLVSDLGDGAMGRVYRADQLDVAGGVLRAVALKVVRPELADDELAQRFQREIRVTAKLRNPHIVTVHDAGRTDDGRLYFTMELVRGSTLAELLRKEATLKWQRVVAILLQLCDALATAHGLDEPVVHRDLKPSNIFVEPHQGMDWVKVGDFGIAKVLGERTADRSNSSNSPGTPRYMATEQWRGQPVDGRTDLYALGVIAYEMLAGRTPFDGTNAEALMYQHLDEVPEPLPDTVQQSLRALVKRLLAKDPRNRPQSAEMVAAALRMGESDGRFDAGASTTVPDFAHRASPADATLPDRGPEEHGDLGFTAKRSPWFVLKLGSLYVTIGSVAVLGLMITTQRFGGLRNRYGSAIGSVSSVNVVDTANQHIQGAGPVDAGVADAIRPSEVPTPSARIDPELQRRLLRPAPRLEPRLATIVGETVIRASASSDAAVLGSLDAKTEVMILDEQGEFTKVLAPAPGGRATEGWILTSAVRDPISPK